MNLDTHLDIDRVCFSHLAIFQICGEYLKGDLALEQLMTNLNCTGHLTLEMVWSKLLNVENRRITKTNAIKILLFI